MAWLVGDIGALHSTSLISHSSFNCHRSAGVTETPLGNEDCHGHRNRVDENDLQAASRPRWRSFFIGRRAPPTQHNPEPPDCIAPGSVETPSCGEVG